MLFGKIVDINSIEKRVRQSAANMGPSRTWVDVHIRTKPQVQSLNRKP